MSFSSSLPRIAALAVLMGAAACGDNHDAPEERMPDAGMSDPEFDEDGCRILSVGPKDFSFNLFFQLLGVKFPVSPNLEGERDDVLHIELWDSTTPNQPALITGTFDLANSSNLATCQHCVWVEIDATEDDGLIDNVYVATQGTITIDKVTDPLDAVFAAHTSRVVLRRATVGDNSETTLVPNGDCVSLTAVSFDTTPTQGATCESAEDCGNALLEICDPSSNTCAPPECNFDEPCTGGNEICLIQYGDLFSGACYQVCDPQGQTPGLNCPSTQQCAQRGVDPTFGICKTAGEIAPGLECEIEDNSTSCTDGAVCSSLSHTCAPSCSYFAEDTGCLPGTACSIFWQCERTGVGDPAALGGYCGASAEETQGCGSDGEAFRGICFSFPGHPLKCEKACLGNEGCTDAEFCALRYSSGLGVCLPLPVCGDGVVGEINEICDDGDTDDGDGCSSDCQTVDTNYLCANASTLTLGASTQGNTATGVDGLMSGCQAGLARADLYEITPPGPGRLQLHLTSATAQSLSARDTCADPLTERGCEGEFGIPTDEELTIQITDPTPPSLTVMVSALTVLEEGSYTISADFTAEDCGNGTLEGREVCDDTNQMSNDGCSADCRTIEYDYYCTQAPALSTSTSNTGTLDGAPVLYEASCDVDNGEQPHESRLYTFTAPAAGTLHLQLIDDTSFAVLSVRDSCGAPASAPETACRPAFLDGTLDISFGASGTVSVVVSPYFAGQDLGSYTLTATFEQ